MRACRWRNRLAEEGIGFKIAMSGLDGGRINIGACSLGGAQSALDKALSYAGDRKAFGKRIADFQALQFKLADMATELECARTLLWRAASALDAKALDATRLCAMAKRVATDTGFEVANDALQIHGGYGYLADYGIEKIVRDLRVHQILEGTNEVMRLIVARDLVGRGSVTTQSGRGRARSDIQRRSSWRPSRSSASATWAAPWPPIWSRRGTG